MKYSKRHIDRAGVALYEGDVFVRKDAWDLVGEWRESHLFVLDAFVATLIPQLAKRNIRYAFFSSRLKRMVSIEEKLKLNPTMGLGGMQDIGGMRIVFDAMTDLQACRAFLETFVAPHFVFKRITDYISTPKESGYRSVHYVYQYEDETDEEHDGLKIELQIRTRLQHSWAMAVETASLIAKTTLKANKQDATVWRDFFKITSAVLAIKEQCSPHANFQNISHDALCRLYQPFAEKYKMIDQLQALRATVSDAKTHNAAYAIVLVNFNKRTIRIAYFEKEQGEQIAQNFTEYEKSLNTDEAIIFVSTDKMQQLRDAYPSYFLDTQYFLSQIDEFHRSCHYAL